MAAAGGGFRCGSDSGCARRPGRGVRGRRWRGSWAGRRASCTARRPGACRCSRRGWPRWRRDSQPWPRLAAAPYLTWLATWHEAAAGGYLKAAVTVAPLAIPLGLVAGGLAWSWRIYTMETGSGGLAPSAPAAFDQRQWRHQVRTARARIAAPGSVPLLLRDGSVVAGATIRAVRHPARPLAVLPYPRLRSHQVVLGTTGTGKTTLLLRLWAGFMARGMELHAAGRSARARCSSCWTARAGPIPGGLPTGPAGCSAARAPRPPRSGPTRPACHCGRCRPASSSARWWTWSSRAPAAPPTTPTCWRRSSGWRWRPRAGRRPARPTSSPAGPELAGRWPTRARRTAVPPGCCGPRPGTSATWRCGTGRCCAGWAAGWTGRAASVTPTPGTASWRGPPRSPWPRRRPGRWSTCWPGSRRARSEPRSRRARPGGTSCSRWTSSAPCRGGCRSGSCTSGPARSGWPSRCRPSPGQGWPPMRTSGTGWRPPRTAASGCCARRTRSPSRPWPGTRRVAGHGPAAAGRAAVARAHEGLSRAEGTPVVDPEIIRGLDVGQAAYIYRGGVTYVQVKRLVAGPAELAGPSHGAGAGPRRGRGAGWRRLRAGGGWPAPRAADPAGAADSGRRAIRPPGRPQRAAGRGVRRGAVMGLPGAPDPFSALGLLPRADLTDDDVRSAWRRIAAATHPDRADGGDPGRFAAAAAAYTLLRTRAGRGEALADLATSPPPPPAPGPPRPGPPGVPPPRPGLDREGLGRARWLSRIRRGRPARLALRVLIAAAVGAVAAAVDGFQPATPALIAGALTWLLLTARHDLAPPSCGSRPTPDPGPLPAKSSPEPTSPGRLTSRPPSRPARRPARRLAHRPARRLAHRPARRLGYRVARRSIAWPIAQPVA